MSSIPLATELTRGLLVLSLLFTLTPVAAAPATDASARATEARAKALFAKAEAAYQVGRFEEALENFTAVYELAPHPEILFNLGQCHRHLGNPERAAFFYRGYLRTSETAPRQGELATKLLSEMEQKAAEAALARKRSPSIALVPGPGLQPESASPLITPEVTTDPDSPSLLTRWWFWAGAAAVVTAGVATYVVASADQPARPTLGEIRF